MQPMIFILSLVSLTIFIVALTHISMLTLARYKRYGRDGDRRPDQNDALQAEQNAVSADFTALVEAITKEGRASRAEEKREDDDKKLREWITIGLIAGTLGAIGWQVSEMVKVYDPISNQADAMQRNLVAANRAWIEPIPLFLAKPLEEGGALNVGLYLANRGREPAVDICYILDLRSVTYLSDGASLNDQTTAEESLGRNRTCDGLEPTSGVGVVLYPAVNNRAGTAYSFPHEKTYRKTIADVLSRTASLVVDGCIAYHTFGQRHFSAFRDFLRDVPGPSCTIVHPTPSNPSPAGLQTPTGVMQCWNFQVMLTGNEAN